MGPDGEVITERFGLVVLSVGTRPPLLAKATADALDIDLNPWGFCETDKFTPLATSQPGVYVCGTFQSPKEIAEAITDAAGAAGDVMRLMRADLGKGSADRLYPFLSSGESLGPERDVTGEAPRVGLFVCDCHPTIDSIVDTELVTKYAEKLPDVAFAARVGYGCFEEGLAQIRQAIEQHNLNRVVVAGCSHRTHESLFQRTIRGAGLNPYLFEMVNIREHCAWVHSSQPRAATRKAMELVRGAVARSRLLSATLKQARRPASRALIVGGGVAGLTAALTIADSGYDVALVERSSELGGNLRHVYFVAEGQNPQRLLRDLVNRTRGHERIRVYTRSEVIEHAGTIGNFRSTIRGQHADTGEPVELCIDHGVTIVATGGEEWRGDAYLLGQSDQVITGLELEEQLVHRPEEIADLRHVVMIQCVRSPDSPDYCSRICCTNSMKNAIRIKLLNPDCQVTILYKDIITYGFREQYYTEARRRGTVFIRYDDEQKPVVEEQSGRLRVSVVEPVLKRDLEFEPDLLVLSMAVVPSRGTPELAKTLGVPLALEGFFKESHVKMRPMDFTSEGVFVAGMAHYPKFIEETIANAQAAAGRAITLLSRQTLFVGGAVAQVDQEKCVGCLTCVRTCPFAIPQIQPQEPGVGALLGAAFIDPAICQGCGTCTGECPAKAIQLINNTDEQIMAQGMGAWQVSESWIEEELAQ
jgi:heterodisulfide reductase subunit A